MNIMVGKSNVAVCYDEAPDSSFTRIEIWFHFGSNQDGSGQCGIAHFIEHLLLSLSLASTDIYSFYHAYGYTNKEKIRIYIDVHKSMVLPVLKAVLNDIITFNVSEFVFEYQKAKISFEIEHTRFSRPVEAVQAVEKMVFSETGYDRSPIGNRQNIKRLTLSQVKSHLHTKLRECGMILSLAGYIPNMNEVIETIDATLFHMAAPRKADDSASAIFSEAELVCKDMCGGELFIVNCVDATFTHVDNMVCSRMLERYLRFHLRHLPIDISRYEYRILHALSMFIPEQNASSINPLHSMMELLTGNIVDEAYSAVLSCVKNEFLYIAENNSGRAVYNAEQLFLGSCIDLNTLVSHIQEMPKEKMIIYMNAIPKTGRHVHVSGAPV